MIRCRYCLSSFLPIDSGHAVPVTPIRSIACQHEDQRCLEGKLDHIQGFDKRTTNTTGKGCPRVLLLAGLVSPRATLISATLLASFVTPMTTVNAGGGFTAVYTRGMRTVTYFQAGGRH